MEQARPMHEHGAGEWLVRAATRAAAALGLIGLAACSSFSFGPDISRSGAGVTAPLVPSDQQNLPAAAGEPIGTGPVRVALLLPVSGDLSNVGISMANGARLAMQFIARSPNVNANITLVLKDTGGDPATAGRMASQAISEGSKLILGPLRAESVEAAGRVAQAAGVPVIGFSNNSGAASPGVYLLNVLPEGEVRRSLSYARAQGRRGFAAIVPDTDFGRIQGNAFRQAVSDLGLSANSVFSFTNETQARQVVEQLVPQIMSGAVDAVFLPDRATAPSFAALLEAANVDKSRLTIIGSADWDNDVKISQTPFLVGAVYPAIDNAGMQALLPDYQRQFGATPHPFATIAYTATLLANSAQLALGSPPYDRNQLTRASGFNGRDGLFRFLPDGRSEYALVMKQVVIGGAQRVDGPKLP